MSKFKLRSEVTSGGDDKTFPSIGDTIEVRYTGTLQNGKVFDSNEGKDPFTFQLGKAQVIEGWDVLFRDLSLGASAKLHIPAHMAYGERGYEDAIPPNSDLTFDVQVLSIKKLKGSKVEPQLTEAQRKAVADSFVPEYLIKRTSDGQETQKKAKPNTRVRKKKKKRKR